MTELEEVHTSSIKDRAKKRLERDFGHLVMQALTDPLTIEVLLNADGNLWQERLGEKMRCVGTIPAARAESILKTIAGYHNKEITRQNPIIEGELPTDGSRFAGQLPPVVPAPTFAIRKRAIAIYSLDEYVADNIMTAAQRHVLINAVRDHRNILVVGGTGSGKTTLVNAIINAMVLFDPSERIVWGGPRELDRNWANLRESPAG